ncbi:MAG: PEP-CTERM sorting domain-containing protein [Armatimonadaceae bacterium]
MRNILVIGSVLVLSAVATTAQAQNLLTNGSFERFRGVDSVTQASITGVVGTGTGSGIAGGNGGGSSVYRTLGGTGVVNTVDLDGWKITSGIRSNNGTIIGGASSGIEVVGSSWSYTGDSGAATNNGFQSISLAGTGASMISQTVSVVAGQKYSLDYWYAAEATNFYNNGNALIGRDLVYDIVIDGVVTGRDQIVVASHTYKDNLGNNVVRTQGNMGWKFAKYEWVASKTGIADGDTFSVDIGFAMQSGFGQGIALDNVNFQAVVPEPGSFVLAGLGLLPLGYMIRRRKNDAE